jgi:hypothetical protein
MTYPILQQWIKSQRIVKSSDGLLTPTSKEKTSSRFKHDSFYDYSFSLEIARYTTLYGISLATIKKLDQIPHGCSLSDLVKKNLIHHKASSPFDFFFTLLLTATLDLMF